MKYAEQSWTEYPYKEFADLIDDWSIDQPHDVCATAWKCERSILSYPCVFKSARHKLTRQGKDGFHQGWMDGFMCCARLKSYVKHLNKSSAQTRCFVQLLALLAIDTFTMEEASAGKAWCTTYIIS